ASRGLRPPAPGRRLPPLPRARGGAGRPRPPPARARGPLDLPPAHRARRRRARRRSAARGPRARRWAGRRLRVRALRLPAARDRARRARHAARLTPQEEDPGGSPAPYGWRMARLLTLPAGRRSKFLVAAVFI